MADIDYDGYGGVPRISGAQAQRLVHMAGAACSLALIVGVGLWGYRLAVRDVSGIPVIRAAEAPMRIAPANPGGEVADHQGMAVNVIAEAGGAMALPQEIILAPAPVDLAAEDNAGLVPLDPVAAPGAAAPTAPFAAAPLTAAPLAADPQTADPQTAGPLSPVPMAQDMGLAAAPAPSAGDPALAAAPEGAGMAPGALGLSASDPELALIPLEQPSTVIVPPAPVTDPTQDAVALALAEALADDPAALAALGATDAAPPEPEAASDGPLTRVGEPVVRSPRPVARPDTTRAPLTDVQAVSASVGNEIDASTLKAGTRLVQLGAFDSPDMARGEWAKLSGKFGDLMTGKSLVIQSAQSGGRTFFRLRAHGFEGEDDARRFCAALLAEDAACIPVAHR